MKNESRTLLHSDYWCEVPAGKYQTGLTDTQKDMLWDKLLVVSGYDDRSPEKQVEMLRCIDLMKRNERVPVKKRYLFVTILMPRFIDYPAQTIHLDTFYIARFPILEEHVALVKEHKKAVKQLPGVFELPEFRTYKLNSGKLKQVPMRRPAEVLSIRDAARFCSELGGRLPSSLEWEKAAHGTDGRLYPWGNDWDDSRGWFYWEQDLHNRGSSVDVYPGGVSPYGVWSMAGNLPEVVVLSDDKSDSQQKTPKYGLKGCHPKESTKGIGFFTHALFGQGVGDHVTFRPVLDKWPQTQWPGVSIEASSGSNR